MNLREKVDEFNRLTETVFLAHWAMGTCLGPTGLEHVDTPWAMGVVDEKGVSIG